MAQINRINDGGRSYGSATIVAYRYNGTTYASLGTYLTDDFSITEPSNTKEFTDNNDVASGQISTRSFTTGRATLQFATSITDQVQFGDVFKWDNPVDATPTNAENTRLYFYVDSVERAETKGDEAKQAVSFRRVENPTTFKATPKGGSESGVLDLTALIVT